MMCDFPGCQESVVGHGPRCLSHERVLVNPSYLTATEVQDE